MSSSRYLLRVEAINIYSTIHDTDQLSVVRGGGLLLRRAIIDVGARADRWGASTWRQISLGASVGVFAFTSADPAQVKARVCSFLVDDPHYGLFTFAVACAPWADGESFRDAQERALADLRWQQQQQPSIAFDAPDGAATQVCDWSHQRAARPTRTVARGDDKHACVSESVHRRFRYGLAAREGNDGGHLQSFYTDETDGSAAEVIHAAAFAKDLHEIADDPQRGNLSGKLAVFYADGNRFSALVRGLSTHEELDTFDQDLRAKRKALLAGLLNWAWRTKGMRHGKRLRFEVLLWGGDELMIVVPAWCGIALLAQFFTLTDGWAPKVPAKLAADLRQPNAKPALTAAGHLTHAAALVMCNAKTPIARIRTLTNELAQRCKDRLGNNVANVYEALALESVDYPAEALDSFYERRVGKALCTQWSPRLPIPDPGALRDTLAELPRSQVYALAQLLVGDPGAAAAHLASFEKLQGKPGNASAAVLSQAMAAYAHTNAAPATRLGEVDPWIWLHLRELWDYLAVDPEASPTAADLQEDAA